MLTFYINRAGKNLTAAQRKTLEQAKDIIRADFGKEKAASPRPAAKKAPARKTVAAKRSALKK